MPANILLRHTLAYPFGSGQRWTPSLDKQPMGERLTQGRSGAGWGEHLDAAPRSASTRPDGRRAGLFYVPRGQRNVSRNDRILSRVRRPLPRVVCNAFFADPADKDKSPWPSVAQPGLEPRVALHVTRSGVTEGRSIVPLPERLAELVSFGTGVCGTSRTHGRFTRRTPGGRRPPCRHPLRTR